MSAKALDTALDGVAVYRSWRSRDPGRSCPPDARFAAMPALTKKDIRENFPRGILPPGRDVNRGLASGEIELVETSGTTDDRITSIWNQSWWDASERASWQLNSIMARTATGDHREAILVNAWNVGFVSDSADLPLEKRCLSRFLYLNEKTDPLSWSTSIMDRMINELSLFQPAILEANPSLLARLCRYIMASNKTVFQPEVIVFTYEYPTLLHYRQIRRVFQAPTASSYGTTETGYVFMQCEEGKFHQNSQFCRVDFEPFKPGQGGPFLGRILVTPFHNPWSLIVHFDTGDLVTLEESGKCPCGRNSGLILSAINGRRTNLTLTVSGRLVTLSELDRAVSELEGTEEYKLTQSDSSTYELRLVYPGPQQKLIRDRAVKLLKNIYGPAAQVRVIFDTAIAAEASGKYRISGTDFPLDMEQYLDRNYLRRTRGEGR